MTKSLNPTAIFIRTALVAAVGIPFIAINAFAQAPAPSPVGGTAQVERVVVTGSLIPTAEEVGANPVFAINRDLMNKSGQAATVETILKSQPIFGASSVPVQNNSTGQGGPVGTASISLRGFDPGASLVLINGRRVAPFPGSANSGAGFVDLTTIPIAAVQSFEILKDGASTTYGADAVAGVVNIKLYQDFRGAQVTTQYGNTLDKDAAEYYGDILFGVGDDNTNVVGDIFYYKHHSMFTKDRGNTNRPPFLSSNTSPYNLQLQVGAVENPYDVNGNRQPAPVLTPEQQARTFIYGTPPDLTNGLAPADSYIYDLGHRVRSFGGLLPGFNFDAFQISYPEQERWGGYASLSHKICDDQLQMYGDFYYVDGNTHDELAPNATGSFFTPGSFVIFIPPNHPGALPYGGPTPDEVGMPAGAYNPFNPFQQILSGGSRARIADFGNRLIDNENIAERFTVGAKGDKLFDGNWGYDSAFVYSQIEQISQIQDVNGPRFERILNANDSLFNPLSGDYIGQTTPYNPFNDFRRPIATNQPLINFATLRARSIFTSKLATLDSNIYTTDLFDLPGGGIGLAVGGGFSREDYNINPDDQLRLQEELGVGRIDPVHAGRKEWNIYAETSIPIFGPNWNFTGFHALEITAGVRYQEFLNNSTNAAVPKVGIRWQPFDEQLTVRSTWGEGFLEPSLTELYGPIRFLLGPAHFVGFSPPGLPLSGQLQDVAEPETTIEQLPNPNLGPEHDRTWTGGIVYTPKWIPTEYGTVTLTVDLWDIERTGVVVFLGPSSIIAGYNQGIYPGIVSPANPSPATGPGVLFDPQGNYAGVTSPYLPAGKEKARGVDLGLQYQIETTFGTWTWLTRVTYLDSFVYQFPGSIAREVAGRANNGPYEGSFFGDVTSGDAWFKWKGITNIDWTWHNWDLNWTMHLYDGFWEQLYSVQFDGFWKQHYVHPTWFNDVQLSYTLVFEPPVEQQPVAGYSKGKEVVSKGKEAPVPAAMPCWKTFLNNSTFTVGVNNIWGEDPPAEIGFESGNAFGIPGSTYDNLGRFWYARLTKKF
jgi:iron complex outermembrane receptor protein